MQGKFYDIPEKYKFSVAFESKLVPLTTDDAQKYISLASQDTLKKYFPKDIDFNEKEDCLAIAGQSFIANKINLNDDGVDTDTAIRIADLFPYSYIDALHKRDTIIGVILAASFTDIETNKELSKSDVKNYKKPFAVTIGGLVWKLANKKFTQALQDDKLKDSLYFSWELGFNDYNLIKLPKGKYDFTEGSIINDLNSIGQVKELDNKLRANGGSGELEDGSRIARVIVGDVIPLGVGIVENPAGQLDPLVVNVNDQEDKNKSNADVSFVIESTIDTTELIQKLTKISEIYKEETQKLMDFMNSNFTSANLSVIQNNNENTKFMDKIVKIEDITDENLKQCKASVVHDFISQELLKTNSDWKQKLEDEKSAKVKAEALTQDVQKQLDSTKADLKKVQDQIAAKEAEELFNQRMTYFDDTYELSKEERQTISADIKGLDNDNFDKLKNKYEIFLKDKSKASIKAKQEAEKLVAEAEKNKNTQVSTASKVEEKVIDDALKNGKETTAEIPNAQGGEQDFKDKFKEAFKPENCVVVNKR